MMSRDRWTITLVLLKVFINISQENEINHEIGSYGQENSQDDGTPETMMLPQDCFEACNDYECLFLCPQPLRGVKRCITPLKSNKKNCCPNGQKEPSTTPDKTKTTGKHIGHARDQFLGIKKELTNDLANKRYSLLKGLPPFTLKQHSREPLFKLGTKPSKSKTVPLVCPVNNKKVTNPPNNCNCVSPKNQENVADDKNGNHIPPKLPFYSEEESTALSTTNNGNGRISGNNDVPGETTISMITGPVLKNENVEDIIEQVTVPNPEFVAESNEEILVSSIDESGGTRVVETGQGTDVTRIPKPSFCKDCINPDIGGSKNESFLNRPSSHSSIDTDRPHNYNYEAIITNGGEIETMGQKIIQSFPVVDYAEPHRDNPLQMENNVLSQTNQYDFLYTTPLIQALSSSVFREPSKLETAEYITPAHVNYANTFNTHLTEFERPNQEIILDNGSKLNENIIVESSDKHSTNGHKSYTGSENVKDIPRFLTNESSLPKLANIETTTSSDKDMSVNNVPSSTPERIMAESYLGPDQNEHLSHTSSKTNKINENFPLSNESDVRTETDKLGKSENHSFTEKDEMADSSDKLNNTEHNDNGMTKNDRTSETDDKNSLLELLRLSASANDQKHNYTSRILQELISKYNITSIIDGKEIKGLDCKPLNNSLDHEASKHHLSQENQATNSNLPGHSAFLLQSKPNENESYLIDSPKRGQYSSKSTIGQPNIAQPKLDVDKAKGEETTHLPSRKEFIDELSSDLENKRSYDGHDNLDTPVKSSSNIFEPLRVNNDLTGGKPYPSEESTTDSIGIIKNMAKDNTSNTIIGDFGNGLSLDNGISSGNQGLIDSSHSQILRSEQASTTIGIYPAQKGSFKHSTVINDTQADFHSNQSGKNIFHMMKNSTDKKPESKNINITENQFDVEGNIEEPMSENNFSASKAINVMENPDIFDQELMFDAGNYKSMSFETTSHDIIANKSVNRPINEQFYHETNGSNSYDQGEKVLELIPNVSKIPLPTSFEDKSSETVNRGIEEVYLKLEDNNGNSSSNFENDDNYSDLYESKNPDDISTDLNDSESYALQDNGDSIINKKKLSDIINTELNSIKQQNVIVKKREDEEDVSYSDDPLCDCDYPTGRDEEPDFYPSSGRSIDSPNVYPHPLHPILVVVPVPISICDCQNKTNHNSLDNNHIGPVDPYLPRAHPEPLPNYSFSSDDDSFQFEREGKAVQGPPHGPNLFIPYVPLGRVYTIVQPHHRLTDQQDDKYSLSRFAMKRQNEDNKNTETSTERNPGEEGLENSNSENMAELHHDLDITPDPSDTQRFLRQEHKETETHEYVFIDGQYVKVLKSSESRQNEEVDKKENTPTAITETPIADTSTTAANIYTTQETYLADRVETKVAMNPNENDHWRVNQYYPGEFEGDQNPFYGYYYPSYVYTHLR